MGGGIQVRPIALLTWVYQKHIDLAKLFLCLSMFWLCHNGSRNIKSLGMLKGYTSLIDFDRCVTIITHRTCSLLIRHESSLKKENDVKYYCQVCHEAAFNMILHQTLHQTFLLGYVLVSDLGNPLCVGVRNIRS